MFCFCRSLPNLSELNLRSCKIADAGMEALAEALLVKRNIKKLDLRYDVIMTRDVIMTHDIIMTHDLIMTHDIIMTHDLIITLSCRLASVSKEIILFSASI